MSRVSAREAVAAVVAVALVGVGYQAWQTGVSGVLPDQILAYLLACAVVTGLPWLEDGSAAWLALAAVFLAAAALTKSRGRFSGSRSRSSSSAAGSSGAGAARSSASYSCSGRWRSRRGSSGSTSTTSRLGDRVPVVRAPAPGLPRRADRPVDLRGRPHVRL